MRTKFFIQVLYLFALSLLLGLLLGFIVVGVASGDGNGIVIDSIGLSSTVVPVNMRTWVVDGITYGQYEVDNNYVGWHNQSAPPGMYGNTVMNGHSNVYGKVFHNLNLVRVGDEIEVYFNGVQYNYTVTDMILVRDVGVSDEEKAQNGSYIMPTDDYRLTLVTCVGQYNEYRLIVIAHDK